MDGIFFLFLAFLTTVASIKLSNFGDALSKQSKVGSMLIGGILIASITSLPEFVTSISATILNNPTLSFGDILGSNIFNIFSLSIFNIIFLKKEVFKNTSKIYIFECLLLIIDYIIIYLGCNNMYVSLTSLGLILFYIVYMLSIIKRNPEEENVSNSKKENYIIIKFVLTGITMIFLSILLTFQADKISRIYPNFSSSTIGAILLGVTTSLPEVVTTFELLRLNNFNMAISNILGSNIFNFLVLSISDFFFKNGHIYSSADKYSLLYLYGGIMCTLIFIFALFIKNKKSIFYILISLIISLIYLSIWYFQFI